MSAMKTVLSRNLANWIVTEMKLRQFHWHVKGPHFFTLHAKFEELYDEAAGHIDDLAERLLALGDTAVPTLADALRLATVQETADIGSAKEMVKAIVDDFDRMIEELQTDLAFSASLGDEGSHDLLLDIQAGLQKHVWMLSAFLQ